MPPTVYSAGMPVRDALYHFHRSLDDVIGLDVGELRALLRIPEGGMGVL